MKIVNVPGEYGFRALFLTESGWGLSIHYYFDRNEAVRASHQLKVQDIKWPVEISDNGSMYIPDQSELE